MLKPLRFVVLLTLICHGGAARESTTLTGRRQLATTDPSCTNRRAASAMAVSIVYAVCNNSVVLSADSIATAAASGCGDAYAAGVGLALATLSPTTLASTSYATFAAALSSAASLDRAVAVAQGLAVSVASATSPLYTREDMVRALADAVLTVAAKQGCGPAIRLVRAVAEALLAVSQDLLDPFMTRVASITDVGAPADCPALTMKPNRAAFPIKSGGKALGGVDRPIFSAGVESMRTTSSLAVSIAEVACPAPESSAAVVAIAVATAASNDTLVAADAIAGVITAGVDVVAVVTQLFLHDVQHGQRVCVQAVGTAIVALTAEEQVALLDAAAAALQGVASGFGCSVAGTLLSVLQSTGVTAQMSVLLCSQLIGCPSVCPPPARR